MQEKLENEMETTILGSGFLVGIAGVEGFEGGLDGQGYKVTGLGVPYIAVAGLWKGWNGESIAKSHGK